MANPVMALRRRQRQRDVGQVPRAGGYAPGWDVPPAFNFTRDVVEAFAADPLLSALTFVDREGIVDRRTFAEVAGDAARWAHLLRTRLDRGDRVMIVVGKVPAWHGAMLGAIKGGLVAVPCPNMLRARDLAFRVRDSGARLVIADRECEPEIEEMRNQIGDIVAVLYLDEAKAELSRYRGVAPTEETTAGESALILYTSGTTKDPKGVVHTHAYTWAQRMQAGQWLDAREGDIVWCTASTGWAKAVWNVLLGPWSHGAEVVIHESAFEPEERLSLIQKLGITVLCQAPTEYRMMAKLDKLAMAYAPRLRHAVSAGEPLNPEVIGTFQDAFGITVRDGYGQTENSLLVANMPGAPVRPGSMGLPTEGHDVAIIDEAGNVCEPGAEGDIALLGRPPTLFRGYWNDPDATDAAFRDGWYVTGDRATRDEDGHMWFVGRTDDVILSAAYRIGPFEVESALLEHPAVAESAVVGVPDADRGQIVKAFVVLRPGHEPGDELAVELQDHVKAVTAPYKYPRAISFVDELPKTTSGKIRRSELREMGESIEEFVPVAAASAPLHAVPDLAELEAEAIRLQAEEMARRELARDRARAAAAEAERAQAEAAARRAAEEAERSRVEAEELYRIRALAEEQARQEADAAERALADAEPAAQLEVVATEDDELARAEGEAAERARLEAEAAERARLEVEAAEQARIEAEAAEQARLEAAEEARREAEEAERARAEAEAAAEQARLEAEAAEQARIEAEETERARAEAEAAEHARLDAEAAEQARIEAEAAERARIEAEAAERARLEAEEAERARAEAEAAEQARLEAEAERARAEAEAAEQARLDAEAAERARVEAEAAERASLEAEEQARREAEEAERARAEAEAAEQARREAEEAERARAEAEAAEQAWLEADVVRHETPEELAVNEAEELAAGEAEEADESWRDARRRKREEAAQRKSDAEAAKRRAKEEAEQRKRDEAAAREAAKQRAIDEKEAAKQRAIDEKQAAKQRAIDEKRHAEEEKIAAKQRVEDEKRHAKEAEEQREKDEVTAREQAKRRGEEAREAEKLAEDAKRRKHDALRPRRGLSRLLPGDEPKDDYGDDEDDDEPVEPITGIVERLQRYSGVPGGAADAPPAHEEPTPIDATDGAVTLEPERIPESALGDALNDEHVDERRSAP